MYKLVKANDELKMNMSFLLPYIYCNKFINSNCDRNVTINEINEMINKFNLCPTISFTEFKEIIFDNDNDEITLYYIYENGNISTYATREKYNSRYYFQSDIDRYYTIEECEKIEELFLKELSRLSNSS